MIIIPAVDIRDGKVVRLFRGDYKLEKVYSDDPLAVAQKWVGEGAEVIHIVDLDGAREGSPRNEKVIERLVNNITVPVQMGGGLRSKESVQRMLDCGVERVVVGTVALEKEVLSDLITTFGADHIIVGIDASDGIVKTEGWLMDSGVSVEELCEQIIGCGVTYIIYTDIKRDGTLQGPNIDSLKRILTFAKLQIIAAGGIGGIEDIRAIAELKAPNIYGIIVGRALYEETVNLSQAIELARKRK